MCWGLTKERSTLNALPQPLQARERGILERKHQERRQMLRERALFPALLPSTEPGFTLGPASDPKEIAQGCGQQLFSCLGSCFQFSVPNSDSTTRPSPHPKIHSCSRMGTPVPTRCAMQGCSGGHVGCSGRRGRHHWGAGSFGVPGAALSMMLEPAWGGGHGTTLMVDVTQVQAGAGPAHGCGAAEGPGAAGYPSIAASCGMGRGAQP